MTAASAITQDGVAGELARESPTVLVRDVRGRPVAGVVVTFFDIGASGTQRARTGTDGKAIVGWYVSTHAGIDRMTAYADGIASVEFDVDVHAGPPAKLVPDFAFDQAGEAGETLPTQPSVRVTDKYGNVIPGVDVTFMAAGPSPSRIEHATVTTDSVGRAVAGAWKLGSATGDYSLTAAVPTTPIASVVFRARVNRPFAVSSLAAGGSASCAVATSGETYCWGNALGSYPIALTPDLIWSAPRLVTLVVGNGHACGLTSSGIAYCWGANASGQLGLGTFSVTEPQPRAVAGGESFTTLVAGDAFTCGVTTDRHLYCWGNNDFGQLGIDNMGNRSVPTAVATAERFATISAGFVHACAVATAGTTYCWGADDAGQLGGPVEEGCQTQGIGYYGPYTQNVSCSRKPVALSRAPGTFTVLAASSGTCGLLSTGQPYCWGLGRDGVPNEGRFVTLAAAEQGICGITTTRSISCWSYDYSAAPPSTLTVVTGITDPSAIAAGRAHWCAIGGDANVAFCWGANIDGQLGNGTTVSTARPLPVASP